MAAPRFPLVLVDVSEVDADLASAELFDLGATGIEVRDATTLEKGRAGGPTLVASFDDERLAAAAVARLPAAWKPRSGEIVGDAWRDEYKKYFRPFLLCSGIVVRPPWETYEPKPGEQVLVLDPGRAFGTGLHESTSLVAEALAERSAEVRGRRVLDVGTGSGILSFVALRLGAESARAVDIDEDAVALARENAGANGLADRFVADASTLATLTERFAVVLANIEAGVLEALSAELSRLAAPGALVVLSGLLGGDFRHAERVRSAYARMQHVETKTRGEWAALVLRAV